MIIILLLVAIKFFTTFHAIVSSKIEREIQEVKMINSINFTPFNYVKAQAPSKKQDVQFTGAAASVQEDTVTENPILKRKKPVVKKVAINAARGRIGKNIVRQYGLGLGAGSGVTTISTGSLLKRIKEAPCRLEIVGMNVSRDYGTEKEGLEGEIGLRRLEDEFRYDSILGNYPGYLNAKREDGKLYLYIGKSEDDKNLRKIRVLEQRNVLEDVDKKGNPIPALPWKELGVDIVIECSGKLKTKEALEQHLKAGAKRVILSAPAEKNKVTGKPDVDKTIVTGVNDNDLLPSDIVISGASCTTNCTAPVTKVIHGAFGIKRGFIQTTHAATNSQSMLDTFAKAKNRQSVNSIIPTTTGAAKTIGDVIPELEGKMNGLSARVPTSDGSIAYLVLDVDKTVTLQEVKDVLKNASQNEFKDRIVAVGDNITSVDIIGRPESSLYIEDQVQVIDGNMVVIPIFYDNEWGYTTHLMDLTRKVGSMMYNNKNSKPGTTGGNLNIGAA